MLAGVRVPWVNICLNNATNRASSTRGWSDSRCGHAGSGHADDVTLVGLLLRKAVGAPDILPRGAPAKCEKYPLSLFKKYICLLQ
jgi:hypothetical protein